MNYSGNPETVLRAKTTQSLITMVFVSYMVVAVVISLVMPDEPLAALQKLSQTVGEFVVSINSICEVSKFPKSAAATLSILWISVPFVAFYISRVTFRPHFQTSNSKTSDLALAMVLSAAFFSAIAFFPPILGNFDNTSRPYQFVALLVGEHRMIFGLVAGGFIAAATYMFALCIAIPMHLLFRRGA